MVLTDIILVKDKKFGKISYEKFITRQMVRENPTTIFVFGDNMLQKGFGGQAKEMRGEINTIGIPTKHAPNTLSTSYFSNSDFILDPKIKQTIDLNFSLIKAYLINGTNVIFPSDGIGTGLAKLHLTAPKIFKYIQDQIKALEEEFK